MLSVLACALQYVPLYYRIYQFPLTCISRPRFISNHWSVSPCLEDCCASCIDFSIPHCSLLFFSVLLVFLVAHFDGQAFPFRDAFSELWRFSTNYEGFGAVDVFFGGKKYKSRHISTLSQTVSHITSPPRVATRRPTFLIHHPNYWISLPSCYFTVWMPSKVFANQATPDQLPAWKQMLLRIPPINFYSVRKIYTITAR